MLQGHELSSNPVVHSPHCLFSVQEEKRKQPLEMGRLFSLKCVKATQLILSSQRALHSPKVGTPINVSIRLSAEISHCCSFTKQLVCKLTE